MNTLTAERQKSLNNAIGNGDDVSIALAEEVAVRVSGIDVGSYLRAYVQEYLSHWYPIAESIVQQRRDLRLLLSDEAIFRAVARAEALDIINRAMSGLQKRIAKQLSFAREHANAMLEYSRATGIFDEEVE